MSLTGILETDRANAAAVWVVAGALFVAAVVQAWSSEWLWAAFALVAAGVIAVPALASRRWRVAPPAWVALVAAAPLIARLYRPFTRFATYAAVAALALVVAVNLNALTDVRFTPRVAVVFVVTTTMGLSGLWVMIVGLSDVFLGTGYVAGMDELNREFVASALTGLGGGLLFERYFHRIEHGGLRGLPADETDAGGRS